MEKTLQKINLSLDEIIANNRNDYKFPYTNKQNQHGRRRPQMPKNQQQQRNYQQQQQRNYQQQQQRNNQQQHRQIQHQRGNQMGPLYTKGRNQHGPKIWDYSQIWDNNHLSYTSGKFGDRLITAQKGKPGGVIQVLRTTENTDRYNRQSDNDAYRNSGNIYVEIPEDDSMDWEPEATNGQYN